MNLLLLLCSSFLSSTSIDHGIMEPCSIIVLFEIDFYWENINIYIISFLIIYLILYLMKFNILLLYFINEHIICIRN